MSRSVLIFERDRNSGALLRELISTWGYQVTIAEDIPAALKAINEIRPELVVDSGSAVSGDFALVREIRLLDMDLPVVLVTDQVAANSAVEIILEEGVYHYFDKPLDPNKLRLVLDRAVELAEAKRENERLRRQLRDRGAFGELVGNSDLMREVYTLIEQVAPSSASVLITGDSGTGKELVARTIHKMSPRRDKPFVAINCSAIPETLMESELFGHEKGAFTGVASRRQGCFELADTGPLLLDEIGEMPALLQAKLLRVIEERSVKRLGGKGELPIDVRLLAATNRDPEESVHAGTLRNDL